MARVLEVDMENVVDMEDVVLTNTRILFMIGSNKAGTCKGRTLTENINFQGSPGQELCMSHCQMLGKFEYTLPAKF